MMSELWSKLNRLIPHIHKYEYKKELCGSHGINYTKRYCRWCGHEQWLFYDRLRGKTSWQDSPDERFKKIGSFIK